MSIGQNTWADTISQVEEISNLLAQGSILNRCLPVRSLAHTSQSPECDACCSTLQEPNSVTQLASVQTPEFDASCSTLQDFLLTPVFGISPIHMG